MYSYQSKKVGKVNYGTLTQCVGPGQACGAHSQLGLKLTIHVHRLVITK